MRDKKNRKLNRLKEYDYSRDGWYFITVCTKNREYFFGDIEMAVMKLSEIGGAAHKCWLEIPNHFPNTRLDEFVVMPNHIHGIIVIDNDIVGENVGNKDFCSLRSEQLMQWQKRWARSLSSIVRGFKIGITKWCRENNYENFVWQKSFYDRVIRNEKALAKIREYILNNPLRWEIDRNNVENIFM